MGCIGSRCLQNTDYNRCLTNITPDRPQVQICAPENTSASFADYGDKIALFVNFGDFCLPCQLPQRRIEHTSGLQRARDVIATSEDRGQERYKFEVLIANQVTELINLHPELPDSNAYKAVTRIPLHDVKQLEDGEPVKFTLPYMTTQQKYEQITHNDLPDQCRVYFQSLWKQLKEHNIESSKSILNQSSLLRRPAGYGSIVGSDQQDGAESIEWDKYERQNSNSKKPKRYWPDSWQMQFWTNCCGDILRSDKPIPKFIAQFFVAPLTNVTGLSLHYQLYLNEIFHTTFLTRLGHYLSMPFIVLMMLIFFGQFRFVFDHDPADCYKTDNFEVLILNGTLLLAIIFFLWYLIWGIVQKTCLMGIFMIPPLTILVILANIYFQLSIKNTGKEHKIPPYFCWDHKVYASGYVQYYNIFSLMAWYYNPILWAGALSMFQSLSHIFEPMIPPRVSQTAHWMSCTHMCKRMGYTKTLCILFAQSFFGAVDEFLASPRLLPILILRVGYQLGYQEKEWKQMGKLVKMCREYGDPAIDYIGTGGARHPSTNSIVFKSDQSIDGLKKEVKSMANAMTPRQRHVLTDPNEMRLHKNQGRPDPFLQHFVTLRHYVAQYQLQVYAYGPFRIKSEGEQAEFDNQRMLRDFGHNSSFMNFLNQVRFGLWKMEDDILNRRHLSGCCEPDIEEV